MKEGLSITVANFVRLIDEAEQDLVPIHVGTVSRHLPGWNRNRRGDNGIVDDELTVTRIDVAFDFHRQNISLPDRSWHRVGTCFRRRNMIRAATKRASAFTVEPWGPQSSMVPSKV